ncbi:hypothetical protein [Serratia sp. D1N4]
MEEELNVALFMRKGITGGATAESFRLSRVRPLGHFPLVLLHRVRDSGAYETLLDLLCKGGVSPNVIMHNGCFPVTLIFFPALVKIPATPYMSEVLEVVEKGYPFME